MGQRKLYQLKKGGSEFSATPSTQQEHRLLPCHQTEIYE